MSPLQRLVGAAYGTHLGDQIALVSVPLVTALAFDASAELIGLLVACQSMAHLLGSVPFGVFVDRYQLRGLAIASALISLIGFSGAGISIWAGTLPGYGIAITLAGFGTVLFALTALSILPKAVPPSSLARANAALETPRAAAAFAMPLLIGIVIGKVSPALLYGAAALAALSALLFTATLPRFAQAETARSGRLQQILQGGLYVLRHRLLLAISFCAIFWNLAFAALLVVLVPAIQELYSFAPGAFGIALSAFGLGSFLGIRSMGLLAERVAPKAILLFGPGSSALAALGLLSFVPGGSEYRLYGCGFLLGFGPGMWLVTQNAVRQLVTPPELLGRVNAVIQTSIYGIRPLGALLGGAVTGMAGAETGLIFVITAFALSFAVALFSGLRRVASYDALAIPSAPA